MEEMERNKRKNQIIFMVKLYFDKLNLDSEKLGEWTDKAVNTFLDSDLSIDEINERMSDTLTNNKDSFSIEPKEGNVDLSSMIQESENSITENEDAKQLVKDNKADAGYIDNIVITTLALISFALCGIGLALLYLFN